MMDVAVVIPHWNAVGLLDSCLRALLQGGVTVSAEVVVVDNGSTDGSAAMVRERYPSVRVIRNPENRGFTVACNQGIRATTAPLVVLLNTDTECCPGAIDRLVAYAQAHPDVGVVGSKLLFPDRTPQPSAFPFYTIANRLFHCLFLHRLLPARVGLRVIQDVDTETTHDVDWLMASSLLVRRDVLERVGFLDERSFLGGGDQDLCWRVRQVGYRVVYHPSSVVVHHHGKGSFAYDGPGAEEHRVRFFVEEARSGYYLFLSRRGRLGAVTYLLIAKLAAALRLLLWAMTAWSVTLRTSVPAYRTDRAYARGLVRVLTLPLRPDHSS